MTWPSTRSSRTSRPLKTDATTTIRKPPVTRPGDGVFAPRRGIPMRTSRDLWRHAPSRERVGAARRRRPHHSTALPNARQRLGVRHSCAALDSTTPQSADGRAGGLSKLVADEVTRLTSRFEPPHSDHRSPRTRPGAHKLREAFWSAALRCRFVRQPRFVQQLKYL
jgi:hypothetical protein